MVMSYLDIWIFCGVQRPPFCKVNWYSLRIDGTSLRDLVSSWLVVMVTDTLDSKVIGCGESFSDKLVTSFSSNKELGALDRVCVCMCVHVCVCVHVYVCVGGWGVGGWA